MTRTSGPASSPAAATNSAADNLFGILAMLAAMASFNLNDALIKLVSVDLPTGQIMFLRNLGASILVFGLLVATGSLRPLSTLATPTIGLRLIGELGASFFFITALFMMPIADLIAISQVTPLAVTAGAALFLREPVGWRRWLAALIGLAGVLLIIRPGPDGISAAATFALLSVAFVVVRDLGTRSVTRDTPALMISLTSAVSICVLGALIGVTENWPVPDFRQSILLALAAVFVVGGYWMIVVAMRSGDVGVVAPFRYSVVIYAIVLGYLIWGEIPDNLTLLGAAIVIGAGVYTFARERRLQTTIAARTGRRF